MPLYVMPDLVSAVSEYFVMQNETRFFVVRQIFKHFSAEQILALTFVINNVRIF